MRRYIISFHREIRKISQNYPRCLFLSGALKGSTLFSFKVEVSSLQNDPKFLNQYCINSAKRYVFPSKTAPSIQICRREYPGLVTG